VEGAFGFIEDGGPCSFVLASSKTWGALLAPGRSCTWPIVVDTLGAEPPGTDEGAFVVWGLEDVELIRVF
jgi:hypothetical protein